MHKEPLNQEEIMPEIPEIDLIFTVPYTDFDLLDVEVGLYWLAQQIKQSKGNQRNISGWKQHTKF